MGSRASLDRSPKKNWVEKAGQLPGYIREIARSIEKTGKTLAQAIAIAISRCKVWATGKGVNKDTQAKAAAAIAEWEKLKAKNAAKNSVSATVFLEMEAAADLVELTPMEDLLIQLAVRNDREQSVAHPSGEEILLRLTAAGYAPRPGLYRIMERVGRRSGA